MWQYFAPGALCAPQPEQNMATPPSLICCGHYVSDTRSTTRGRSKRSDIRQMWFAELFLVASQDKCIICSRNVHNFPSVGVQKGKWAWATKHFFVESHMLCYDLLQQLFGRCGRRNFQRQAGTSYHFEAVILEHHHTNLNGNETECWVISWANLLPFSFRLLRNKLTSPLFFFPWLKVFCVGLICTLKVVFLYFVNQSW